MLFISSEHSECNTEWRLGEPKSVTPDPHTALNVNTVSAFLLMRLGMLVALSSYYLASSRMKTIKGGVNLLFESVSAGANRSFYGASYTSKH